jgi:hypothetical protein
MRTNRAAWEWQKFYVKIAAERERGRLYAGFPLEIAPDLIVCPHLFDWPLGARNGRGRRDVHTCAGRPRVAVFSVVSDLHRRFLQELVPRIAASIDQIVVVDFQRDTLLATASGQKELRATADQLPLVLRRAWSSIGHPKDAFEELANPPEAGWEDWFFGPEEERPEDAARCEASPLRLWEAFFWRGHTYRYELVDGEVPLVGDLRSPLAAERTLRQCVSDAQRLEGEAATEREGWRQCGRFRMRQEGRIVEIRARLTPADARAAFGLLTRVPGDKGGPSLLGALMAGGDNGKTELVNGWTWSTCRLGSATQSQRVARELAESIRRWTETPATIHRGKNFSLPEESREEWFVRPRDEWLTVFVPFGRAHYLPWEVQEGEFWHEPVRNARSELQPDLALRFKGPHSGARNSRSKASKGART